MSGGTIEILEEAAPDLDDYARVPIAFTVDRVLDVAEDGGGFVLTERMVDPPYVKDYDAMEAHRPQRWAERFDVTGWGFLAARIDGRRVGSAAVAYDTPGVDLLSDAKLAVLWDIRVSPDTRGMGVGSALFRAVEAWVAARGCPTLLVETQNNNAGACRFYARHGCELRAANRGAYPEFPDEVQLLWYKELSPNHALRP